MRKNVVFDVGGVLLRFEPDVFCAQASSDSAVQKLLMDKVFNTVTWAQMDRGLLSVEQAAQKIAATLPEQYRVLSMNLMTSWFKNREGYPGMEGLIRRLKQEGFGLYVLSNAPNSYYEFRAQFPALECFDGEFPSCDYGLLKPDPAIFRLFLSTFSLRAQDCFFIDDSHINVEAALYCGFSSGYVYRADTDALETAIRAWEKAEKTGAPI